MLVKNYRPAGIGMVPAQPGTYLLHAYFDGDRLDLVKANVLGWQISPERGVTPLVIDARAVEIEPWLVVHPDARVECSDGRCWDSLEQWLEDERSPTPPASQDHITAAPAPLRAVAAPEVPAQQAPIPRSAQGF